MMNCLKKIFNIKTMAEKQKILIAPDIIIAQSIDAYVARSDNVYQSRRHFIHTAIYEKLIKLRALKDKPDTPKEKQPNLDPIKSLKPPEREKLELSNEDII